MSRRHVDFLFALTLLVAIASPVSGQDSDGDGLVNPADNCINVSNGVQCDTDLDGYGNHCDGDFDQNGVVNSNDFTMHFMPSFQSGTPSPSGTDMDCNQSVNSNDYTMYFAPQFQAGRPGPSGLSCAGSAPCVDGDHDAVPDRTDNCTQVANSAQCDADFDGYGNACDGDYDQNGAVNSNDYSFFLNDFEYQGIDTGRGTDSDCNGAVNSHDHSYFIAQFQGSGVPGPSALSCAGTVPCGDGDFDGIDASVDNCYLVANPDQSDTDDDGIGDACDPTVTQALDFTELLGNSTFKVVADGQGTIHGFYMSATAASGATAHIKYLRQSLGGQLSAEVIATAAPGESFTDFALDAAIDSQNRPCLVWAKVANGVYRYFYGCRGAGGFVFAELPTSLGLAAPTNFYYLALDSADRPHLTFNQHVSHPGEPNHVVRHAWFDGSEWRREAIPLPSEFAGEASEANACMDIDENDRLHIILPVFSDWIDNPQVAYKAGIAYATKAANNTWTSSLLWQTAPPGSPIDSGRMGECELRAAVGGRLHAAFAVNGSLWYARRAKADRAWNRWSLGWNGNPNELQLDADGNVFFTADTAQGAELVRVDADRSIRSRTLNAYVQSGFRSSAVWLQDSTGIGDTTCAVFHTSPLNGGASNVYRTEIEGCEYPFVAPVLDHIDITGDPQPSMTQAELDQGASANATFHVYSVDPAYQVAFHPVDAALMSRNPRVVRFRPGSSDWLLTWKPQPGDVGVRTFIATATSPQENVARHLVAFHIAVPTADTDGDQAADGADNCTQVDNGQLEQPFGPDQLCSAASCVGDQLDADRDGFGDACEPAGPSGLECRGQVGACP